MLHDIQKAVCRHYGIKRDDLLSDKRIRQISRPRQVCFYLAREMTALSYCQIARLMKRDHSTVIYGIAEIRAKWFERGDAYKDVNSVRAAILAADEPERIAA